MRTIISLGNVRQSTGNLHIPASIISAFAALGALVALWAPAYLRIIGTLGDGFSAQSEALGWSLFAVSASGLGSVVYLAWQDTRDPGWRAAHGLPWRTQSNST